MELVGLTGFPKQRYAQQVFIDFLDRFGYKKEVAWQ